MISLRTISLLMVSMHIVQRVAPAGKRGRVPAGLEFPEWGPPFADDGPPRSGHPPVRGRVRGWAPAPACLGVAVRVPAFLDAGRGSGQRVGVFPAATLAC